MRQAQRPPLVRAVQGHTKVMCPTLRPLVFQRELPATRGLHVKTTEGQTSGKRSDGLFKAPFVSEV